LAELKGRFPVLTLPDHITETNLVLPQPPLAEYVQNQACLYQLMQLAELTEVPVLFQRTAELVQQSFAPETVAVRIQWQDHDICVGAADTWVLVSRRERQHSPLLMYVAGHVSLNEAKRQTLEIVAEHLLLQLQAHSPSQPAQSLLFRDKPHLSALVESVVTHTTDAVMITEAEPLGEPGPRIIYVNQAFTDMTGYSAAEVMGKTPRLLQGPQSDYAALTRLGEALRKWEPGEVETINYKKNGEPFWIHFHVIPVADETGWYTHWIAIERDVTERKNRELRQQFLANLHEPFHLAPDLTRALEGMIQQLLAFDSVDLAELWLVNEDKSVLQLMAYASQKPQMQVFHTLNTFHEQGFKMGEGLPGKTWQEQKPQFWQHVDQHPHFLRQEAAQKAGLKTVYGLPLFFYHQVIGVLVLASEQPLLHLSSFAPFSERFGHQIGAEIRRKQLELELNQVFKLAPDILCVSDEKGWFHKVNPAMCHILGYSEAELLSKNFWDLIYADDLPQLQAEWGGQAESQDERYFEVRCLTASGDVRWLAWSVARVRDDGLIYSVAKDTTERKKLESLLDNAANLARVGAWEVDVLANKITWSEMAYKIQGIDPATVPNPSVEQGIELYPEGPHRDKVMEVFQRAITSGTSWDIESILVNAQGQERWVRTIGNAEFVNGQCLRVYGGIQDIHVYKENELQLQLKTKFLTAISQFNTSLLASGDWLSVLKTSLGILGQTVATDRVVYFQYHEEPNHPPYLSLKLRWASEQVEIPIEPTLKNMPVSAFHEIMLSLQKQKTIQVLAKKLSEGPLKTILKNQGVHSALFLPLFIKGHFHGFLGFGNIAQEKHWTSEEISFLKTVVLSLANAIEIHQKTHDLMDALQEKNSILESIGDGFFSVDRDWTIVYMNQAAEQLMHLVREEVVGKSLWELYKDSVGNTFYTHYHMVMQERQPVHFEDFSQALNIWLDVSVYPSESGISIYFKNITERKRSEAKLKNLNTRLQKHVKDLAISNQELEQFAYVASHDLQEPLRMVSSFLTQIEKKYAHVLDDKGKQYIEFAVDGARRMRQIILDLLEFSRVNRHQEAFEVVNLNHLLEEVSVLLRKKIQETNAVVQWHHLPTIHIPKSPVRQLLQNLVDNALKYVAQGTTPVIQVAVTEEENHWHFSVSDNGIGIDSEYFDKIFIIFQRLHHKHEYSGTGMGLAVCKKIISHLDGTIWVESQLAQGSTFHFLIKKRESE
jgi:PAS domain S-box-containing protein